MSGVPCAWMDWSNEKRLAPVIGTGPPARKEGAKVALAFDDPLLVVCVSLVYLAHEYLPTAVEELVGPLTTQVAARVNGGVTPLMVWPWHVFVVACTVVLSCADVSAWLTVKSVAPSGMMQPLAKRPVEKSLTLNWTSTSSVVVVGPTSGLDTNLSWDTVSWICVDPSSAQHAKNPAKTVELV